MDGDFFVRVFDELFATKFSAFCWAFGIGMTCGVFSRNVIMKYWRYFRKWRAKTQTIKQIHKYAEADKIKQENHQKQLNALKKCDDGTVIDSSGCRFCPVCYSSSVVSKLVESNHGLHCPLCKSKSDIARTVSRFN